MSRPAKVTSCLICGVGFRGSREKPHPQKRRTGGRGLCQTCWCAAEREGKLDSYPRLTRSGNELLNEWDFVRGSVSFRDFPELAGVTRDAWTHVYLRGVKAGDPRAKGRPR